MKQYDNYNPIIHKGDLPIRVLQYNCLDWFENITPDFKDEVITEIDINEFKNGILYNINRVPITESAGINSSRHIVLYENYNQYLWCVCYSLLVIFEEGLQKPMLAGNFTGQLDIENPYIRKAIEVFNNGFDLLHAYKDWQFFQLPNPEKYCEYNNYYILKTNGLFTAAMTFILLHEFAHQYYGHIRTKSNIYDPKKDEIIADEYAIDKILSNPFMDRKESFKYGVIVGLASLIFLNNSLSGGDSHPDIDERVTLAIEKLKISDMDNLWGFTSLSYQFWAMKYNIKLTLPKVVDTYKDLFDEINKQITELKNNS